MTTFDQIGDACRTKFDADIAVTYSIQTQYDNAPFTLDESSDLTLNSWIRFTNIFGLSDQVQNGGEGPSGNTYRTFGECIAQIFSKIESGDHNALTIANYIVTAFRSKTASGVTYRTPYLRRIGRDGRWWQVNVHIPFYSDHIS
jgi:hypothetical protein